MTAALIEAKLLEFLDRDEYTPLPQQAQELASALADALEKAGGER